MYHGKHWESYMTLKIVKELSTWNMYEYFFTNSKVAALEKLKGKRKTKKIGEE